MNQRGLASISTNLRLMDEALERHIDEAIAETQLLRQRMLEKARIDVNCARSAIEDVLRTAKRGGEQLV